MRIAALLLCLHALVTLTVTGAVIESIEPNTTLTTSSAFITIKSLDALGSGSDIRSVSLVGIKAQILLQSNVSVLVIAGVGAGSCVGDVVVLSDSRNTTLGQDAFTYVAAPFAACQCRALTPEWTGIRARLQFRRSLTATEKTTLRTQLAPIVNIPLDQFLITNTSTNANFDFKLLPSSIDPPPATETDALTLYLRLANAVRARTPALLQGELTKLLDFTYLPRPIPLRSCDDDSFSDPCPAPFPEKPGQKQSVFNGLMVGLLIGLVLSFIVSHFVAAAYRKRPSHELSRYLRSSEAL